MNTVTVKPLTKLLPETETFWLLSLRVGLEGETELIEGFAACTLKLKVLDWAPLGLFTLIPYWPTTFKVITIVKELDVTLWIWLPLNVAVPPPGMNTVTVKPLTKLLPETEMFWLLSLRVGLEGEMELIDGLDDCTVKKNVLDCPPSGLLTRMLQVPVALSVATITNEVDVTL